VRQVVRGPYGTQVVETVEYRDTATGFQVLPRLNADQVFLDILPQREVSSAAGAGRVDLQRLSTTVSGRLGEWIDLGGAGRSIDERDSVLLGRATSRGAEQRRVLVRVEELR
jgi:type II secretory pathway component GspD/PulD (secretin)